MHKQSRRSLFKPKTLLTWGRPPPSCHNSLSGKYGRLPVGSQSMDYLQVPVFAYQGLCPQTPTQFLYFPTGEIQKLAVYLKKEIGFPLWLTLGWLGYDKPLIKICSWNTLFFNEFSVIPNIVTISVRDLFPWKVGKEFGNTNNTVN